ncbi:MAG: hypothetical protein FJ109_21985 [Deltaproteobacteria bacterium]|nr:hypothetical protein [Deltaproteobacteria bacterium]
MKTTALLILPFAFAALLVMSCAAGGTYVFVSQDRYVPKLPPEAEDYRGRTVYMPGFENRAEDTSVFYYYSPDRSATYEGAPSLQSYLWYCFEKALKKAGMAVYHEGGPVGAPELWIAILSWTDRKLVVEVVLLKETVEVYRAKFTIHGKPPVDGQPEQLEKAAYQMIDNAVAGILRDRAFGEVFSGVGGGSNLGDEP